MLFYAAKSIISSFCTNTIQLPKQKIEHLAKWHCHCQEKALKEAGTKKIYTDAFIGTKKAKNQVNIKNSSIKVLSNEEIIRKIEKI